MSKKYSLDDALEIERNVSDADWTLYLECMKGVPLSERFGYEEIACGVRRVYEEYLPALENKKQPCSSVA